MPQSPTPDAKAHEAEPRPGGASADGRNRKRILWLHTQPEHYFNCLMDDLARGTGYRVPGMPEEGTEDLEFIAAFSGRGPGWYTDNAQPSAVKTVFLRAHRGVSERSPNFRERYHVDWREDLHPLKYDLAIVSGYGSRTPRELIEDCRRRKIPVILWTDSNLRSQRGRSMRARVRRRLKKMFLRHLIGSVDYQLTANSRGVAYWRYFGAPRERIAVCPYYSDYRRIDEARSRARAEVLERVGLSPADRMFFSAARLVPVKGLDLMIRAFRAGGWAERGYSYVIAGVGPQEAELKALAGEALGRSIRFVGFQQPRDNLALMAQAELLILPSHYEPHGIVVAESLAAGTPVIASDVVGAAVDLVEPGVSGMLFRSGDAGDLQRKLETAVGAMATLRAAARPAFEKWYGRTSPTLVIPQIVRQLLGRRAGLKVGGQ